MSYATVDEVKSMFRDFTDSSDPAVTDAEITLFLDNSTGIIDAKIGTLYTLPATLIDNPVSFSILKQVQMFMVASVIDEILNSYGEADKKPAWGMKAEQLMDSLVPGIDPKTCKQCEPTMKLPDLVYVGTSSQRGKMTISKTSGTIFVKGADNW